MYPIRDPLVFERCVVAYLLASTIAEMVLNIGQDFFFPVSMLSYMFFR